MLRALSQLSRQQAAVSRAAGALVQNLPAAVEAGATSVALHTAAAWSVGTKQMLPAASRAFATDTMEVEKVRYAPFAYASHAVPATQPAVCAESEATVSQDGDYVLMHPVYTQDWVHNIKPQHKIPEKVHEKIGYAAVQVARRLFDAATNYGPQMSEKKWLRRFLFLETVAGVPGMVGGMLRHMRSLRTLRRDYGRIHTLLEEAENERMHLLTFMQMAKPGFLFRSAVLVAQGVFFNAFFVTYIISPRTAHAFVGYLEEEAVKTYTHALNDLEAGNIPAWSTMPAPDLAKRYWRLKDDAKIKELLLAVRADEACHSHVNHTFSEISLDAKNPFMTNRFVDPGNAN